MKVWILKSPEVVIVPPVATKLGLPVALVVESWTFFHPSVPSTYTKVKDWPSVDAIKLASIPPIFSARLKTWRIFKYS